MRAAVTVGLIVVAGALAGGCRWNTDPQDYTSAVAQPTPDDLRSPPEAQPHACTEEGFTLVVGPEPGCTGIEGIAGAAGLGSDSVFFHDPFLPRSLSTVSATTPIRVVHRGDRVADVEAVVRCRPFFNDAREALLLVHRDRCDEAEQAVATDCGFGGRFDETLHGAGVLELRFAGEGALLDVRACVRPDP